MHVEDLTLPESSINAMCFERAKARRLVRLTMYELEHTLSSVARRARWGHISDEMIGKWVSKIPSRSSLPKSQKMISSTQHRPPGSFWEGVDEAGSPKRVAALEASLGLDSRVLRVEVLCTLRRRTPRHQGRWPVPWSQFQIIPQRGVPTVVSDIIDIGL